MRIWVCPSAALLHSGHATCWLQIDGMFELTSPSFAYGKAETRNMLIPPRFTLHVVHKSILLVHLNNFFAVYLCFIFGSFPDTENVNQKYAPRFNPFIYIFWRVATQTQIHTLLEVVVFTCFYVFFLPLGSFSETCTFYTHIVIRQ